MLLITILLVLFPATLSLDCSSIFLPVYGESGSCASWDLSPMASLSPATYNSTFKYILQVCGNIKQNIPSPCTGKASSPAYQYDNTQCYVLGKLGDAFVYPVDPSNTTTGIRISYNNGEGGTSDWPRAVVYDLYCEPSAKDSTPELVYEWPAYTYKVVWRTSYACPKAVNKGTCSLPKFNATWDSLRFRSRPSWFDNVKFGIFIHWGVFSVPSFETEWYWHQLKSGNPAFVEFHNRVYGCSGIQPEKFPCTGPAFSYADFAPMFKAELFDPDHWADVFKKSGAKYVVLTSKHHEGWCNFPSAQHWNWNSMDVGAHRDLLGNLSSSVRAQGLHMGYYHSLREWYNPLYEQDNADACSTTSFVDDVLLPTLKDMVTRYHPEVIWADGAGDAKCTHDSVKYWKAPQFLSWLYNESPVKEIVVANSRWGDPVVGDYSTGGDRFTPGELLNYKWESCYTIQAHSWGYDRTEDLKSFLTTSQLLMQLVSSVSCNGNLLLNVGPMADGTLDPIFEERLLEMGAWLNISGEAIYDSIPWKYQNDTPAKDIWYTASKDGVSVYGISFRAPTPGGDLVLKLAIPTDSTVITLLGTGGKELTFHVESDGLHIAFPTSLPFVSLAGMHAWTVKMTHLK